MHPWFYLAIVIVIVSEVAATSALKAAEGFARLWPSLVVVAGVVVLNVFSKTVAHWTLVRRGA